MAIVAAIVAGSRRESKSRAGRRKRAKIAEIDSFRFPARFREVAV
jgi:hypothetical protein